MTATRRHLAAAFALAAAMAGFLPEGPAYNINVTTTGEEVRWVLDGTAPNVSAGRITYYIDTSSVVDLTAGEFAQGVRDGLEGWQNRPGCALVFLEDDSRPTTQKSAKDRINRIGFTNGEVGPYTYGVAFRLFSKEKIIDTDIVLNPDVHVNDGKNGGAGTEAPWSVSTPGVPDTADLAGVCAHEWGHCLGFDHIPMGRSTMYFALPAGAIMSRSPEIDDLAGAAHRYPDGEFATTFGTVRGTVDVAGTTNERGIHIVAIDYGTGRPAASTFSRPDGNWTLEGLPAGAYRMLAGPLGSEKLRLNVYNPFWKTAATDFLPTPLLDGGLTRPVLVSAGAVVDGIALAVAGVSGDPGEPDGATGTARPIAMGASAGGRISSTEDDDYFSFAGQAGQKVSLYVHAAGIGSDLDPRITLFSPLGSLLRDNRDIRTGSGAFDEEGFDLDARIVDYTLPATGTYFVRVTSDVFLPESPVVQDYFYLLAVLPSDDTPNAFTSTLAVTPAVVDADGAATAQVVFHPRGLTGGDAGAGLDVTFERVTDGDADGSLGPVVDNLDGTYGATLTAPSAPGSDVVRARVDGLLVSEATASYRGPAVASRSDFTVAPRRLRPGAADAATVALVPRDVNGLPHGPGRAVSFSLEGAPDATLGSADDEGDGSYTATLSAGTARESLVLSVTVDGVDLGGTIPAGVGFPLEEVVDESMVDLDALLLSPSTPVKTVKKIQKGRDLLAAVAGLTVPADREPILNTLRKALKQVEVSVSKGAAADFVALALAEAAREASADALAAAAPLVSDVKEEKALAKATALHGKAEALLASGKGASAASKFRAAVKQTLKIR